MPLDLFLAPFPPSPHSLLNLVAPLTSPDLGKILLVMAEGTIRHFVKVLLKSAGFLLPASFLAPAALLRLLATSLAPLRLLGPLGTPANLLEISFIAKLLPLSEKIYTFL